MTPHGRTARRRPCLALAALALVALAACRRPRGITYRVRGTAAQARVHYASRGAASMSVETVALPWEVTLHDASRLQPLTLTAETDQQGVTLSCEIWRGDEMVAQATTSGGFARPAVCHALPGGVTLP